MVISISVLATLPVVGAASEDRIVNAARKIEARLNARVGLAIYDTGSDHKWLYNADQRFPMASTFKVMACAALLARTDAGADSLDRQIEISADDLVAWSPETEAWAGETASLHQLCKAAMGMSDNTAANMVLEAIGGPAGFTAFMHSLGDQTTRLDRWETELNEAIPDDPRDTTSPAAMASSLQKLLLGDRLSDSARQQLTDWLVGNEVGGPLLRAGIPDHWRIGDRTGAGGYGTRGVVAIMWPRQHAPLIAAIYITETEASMDDRNSAIAELGRVLAGLIIRTH